MSYEFASEAPQHDLESARSIATEMLRPAHPKLILKELARLRMLTVSRDIGADVELLLAAYTAELRDYPADIITEALRAWPKTQRFWPSLAELTERLNRLLRPRRALNQALRKGYQKPETSPDWIPPTKDEKTAVSEFLLRRGLVLDRSRGKERPLETEPLTRERRKQIAEETAAFKLIDEDDPRVQARLREMAAA